MSLRRFSALLLLAGFAAPAPASLLMGDAERGAQLHEKHCAACHQSMFNGDQAAIYTRADRRVRSVEGLMAQVERCNDNLGTRFDKDQIDDLVRYLNETFYRFD